MGSSYEDEILRLNQRIKELLGTAEKAYNQNTQLLNENRTLKSQCNDYHEKLQDTRQLICNNNFRIQELETAKEQLFETNQKQKINLNKYLDLIRKQSEKLKNFERMAKGQSNNRMSIGPNGSMSSRSSVSFSGSDDTERELIAARKETQSLKAENIDLEHKLNEAYNLIDDLEFELETLDFVEADREHYENEVRELRRQLAKRDSAPVFAADEATDDQVAEGFRPFAAAATGEEDAPPIPMFASGIDETPGPRGGGDEPDEKTPVVNEYKSRRRELHKRLELLHRQQQKDLPI